MVLKRFSKMNEQAQEKEQEKEWVDPVQRGRGGDPALRVPVKFDPETVLEIDRICEKTNTTRSQFIRKAVDNELLGRK